MHDVVTPNPPILSWSHVLFIMVIYVITGFSVFILIQDIRRLMQSLQQEVSKVEQNRAHIQHLAHHDPLTNLPNRILGERLFNEKLRESEEKGLQLALLFIDLDNFKPVNDALGHAAGDRFLQKISQTITDHLSTKQSLIRFGGDEFIVLAPEISDKSEIDDLCKNLITWCSNEFEVLQTKVVVSGSIGVAQAPYDGIKLSSCAEKRILPCTKRNATAEIDTNTMTCALTKKTMKDSHLLSVCARPYMPMNSRSTTNH